MTKNRNKIKVSLDEVTEKVQKKEKEDPRLGDIKLGDINWYDTVFELQAEKIRENTLEEVIKKLTDTIYVNFCQSCPAPLKSYESGTGRCNGCDLVKPIEEIEKMRGGG